MNEKDVNAPLKKACRYMQAFFSGAYETNLGY